MKLTVFPFPLIVTGYFTTNDSSVAIGAVMLIVLILLSFNASFKALVVDTLATVESSGSSGSSGLVPPPDPPLDGLLGLFTSGASVTPLAFSTSKMYVSSSAVVPSTFASTNPIVPSPIIVTGASAINVSTVSPLDTSKIVPGAVDNTCTVSTSA